MSITIALKPHKNPRIDALTVTQRLRWVFEFIRRDLGKLTPEELAAIGDDLVHATAPWWVEAGWMDGKTRECTKILAEDVRVCQEEIRKGIYTLIGPSIHLTELNRIQANLAPPVGWALPVAATYLVPVRLDLRGDSVDIWRMSESANDQTAILYGVANLISLCRRRLRACPVCGSPFLRRYRQEFCQTKCSNKVRNRRRLDRKGDRQKSDKRGVKRSPHTASLPTA
jgi:hypothetical protein